MPERSLVYSMCEMTRWAVISSGPREESVLGRTRQERTAKYTRVDKCANVCLLRFEVEGASPTFYFYGRKRNKEWILRLPPQQAELFSGKPALISHADLSSDRDR